jgi:hypothetical protein
MGVQRRVAKWEMCGEVGRWVAKQGDGWLIREMGAKVGTGSSPACYGSSLGSHRIQISLKNTK